MRRERTGHGPDSRIDCAGRPRCEQPRWPRSGESTRIGGSATYVDITARTRLSTGDEDKGLGLGATDYGLSAELGYNADGGGVYLLAGRRFLGKVDGLDREDGWLAGVGAWRNVGERTSIGAGYDWRESSIAGGRDPSEVYAYLNVRMSDAWRVNLSASTGLNDANADYGVGLTLTWRAIGAD
ncbi:MAG: hypothetical protein E6Q88_06480 [Lysobacteraceae bacterium]|nr:MAG: hypothetical protein E6Q88_06480 [Xanthomonadaceae bacterium]